LSNPRELAITILVKTQAGSYGNLLLNRYLTMNMPQKNRALITELVYGVIQNKLRLDYIISQFSKIRLSKMSPFVKNAIRLGIYQLFFLDKVPDFAAVNESVNLVKMHEGKRAANFTNAILRNVLRKKDKISYPNRNTDIVKYLSIYYSFPTWLITRWLDLFGTDFTEDLCKAFNERPKLCIRVNTLLTNKEELLKQLSTEGVNAFPGRLAQEALYFLDSPPINQLKSFNDGLFTPQDESSIIASLAVGVKGNDQVLDVAAAPGGKTTHMASLMKNQGKIVAWDIHPHRVKLIEQNSQRLKATIVVTQVRDAQIPDEDMFNKFDKVMIDAPCSGLGVIRRKPDIKWFKKREDILSLKIKQARILEVCSKYVKPGGFLVYSTCSIDPEENQKIVDDFLEKNKHFIYDDLRPYMPEKLHESFKRPYGQITLYPHIHGTDGFFIARLKKTKS
jgi:16S rRNA (cytosine967-C5)-methyltransferase